MRRIIAKIGLVGSLTVLVGGFAMPVLAVTHKSGKEAEITLTENGQPKASIIIAASPTRSAVVAAIELRDHVQKISGAVLPIVPDTAVTQGTRILVGESAATRALKLQSSDFKSQEFMIGVRQGTLILMGRDTNTLYGVAEFSQLKISLESLPSIADDEHGTCFAVYEFLERDCGVRWYAPTELGTVYDKQPTLTVKVKELRRRPAIAFRDPFYVAEYNDYKMAPYATFNNPNQLEARLWQMRMKLGGKSTTANHGLYSYYDRFWEKNTNNAASFEGEHHEYFAQGYKGKPTQMCYTNPGLIAQVVKDACTYFKTGSAIFKPGGSPGIHAKNDWVSVEPMDSGEFCKCDACRAWFKAGEELGEKKMEDVFTSDKLSNYIFQFANAVQKEVSKTCPEGHIAVLAYYSHAFPPTFPVDPKIYVGPCLSTAEWLSPGAPAAFKAWVAQELKDPKSELACYKAWVAEKKHSGRLLSMWTYDCFPMYCGIWGGFHAFPGYQAHTRANQIKMFAEDGINGLFMSGTGEQLDTYVTMKYWDNPNQDIDALLNEFFTRYYGAAGKPIKRVYMLIEKTYADHTNYPVAFINRSLRHQTEEIAWKCLGTEERMNKMAKWMEEARAAKLSAVERQRVELFDKDPWQYMVEGHRAWLNKSEHAVK